MHHLVRDYFLKNLPWYNNEVVLGTPAVEKYLPQPSEENASLTRPQVSPIKSESTRVKDSSLELTIIKDANYSFRNLRKGGKNSSRRWRRRKEDQNGKELDSSSLKKKQKSKQRKTVKVNRSGSVEMMTINGSQFKIVHLGTLNTRKGKPGVGDETLEETVAPAIKTQRLQNIKNMNRYRFSSLDSGLFTIQKAYSSKGKYDPILLKTFRTQRRNSKSSIELTAKEAKIVAKMMKTEIQFLLAMKDHSCPHFQRLTQEMVLENSLHGETFLMLKYCDIGPLCHLIQEKSVVPTFRQIAAIAAQILEALCVIHELGYVHTELSSQTILVQSPGIVKISNFVFLGKLKEENRTRLSTTGPVFYMPPERIRRFNAFQDRKTSSPSRVGSTFPLPRDFATSTGDIGSLEGSQESSVYEELDVGVYEDDRNVDDDYRFMTYDSKADIWALGILCIEMIIKYPVMSRAASVDDEYFEYFASFLESLSLKEKCHGSALYQLFYPPYELLKGLVDIGERLDSDLLKSAIPGLGKSSEDALIIMMGQREERQRRRRPNPTERQTIPKFDKIYAASFFFDFVRQCLFLPFWLRPGAQELRDHAFVEEASKELAAEAGNLENLEESWKSRRERKQLRSQKCLSNSIFEVNSWAARVGAAQYNQSKG